MPMSYLGYYYSINMNFMIDSIVENSDYITYYVYYFSLFIMAFDLIMNEILMMSSGVKMKTSFSLLMGSMCVVLGLLMIVNVNFGDVNDEL